MPDYLMICCLMDTYIHWVPIFVWVLLFRKRVVNVLIVTYISGVFVNDEYLYSRVYVARSGKRCISTQKLKIKLLASKESTKLALSNDAIVALVAASVFAP